MGDVRVDGVVQAAVVRPGDKLIVRVRTDTTPDQAQRLKEGFAHYLPDVGVVVVAAEGMEVYRPDGLVVQPDDVVAVHPYSAEPLMVRGADIALVKPEGSE